MGPISSVSVLKWGWGFSREWKEERTAWICAINEKWGIEDRINQYEVSVGNKPNDRASKLERASIHAIKEKWGIVGRISKLFETDPIYVDVNSEDTESTLTKYSDEVRMKNAYIVWRYECFSQEYCKKGPAEAKNVPNTATSTMRT